MAANFSSTARRSGPGRGRAAAGQGDVQAVGQEGDEDVGFDAVIELMEDRPDARSPLRFLNASSICVSEIVAPQRGGVVFVRLLRNR